MRLFQLGAVNTSLHDVTVMMDGRMHVISMCVLITRSDPI